MERELERKPDTPNKIEELKKIDIMFVKDDQTEWATPPVVDKINEIIKTVNKCGT